MDIRVNQMQPIAKAELKTPIQETDGSFKFIISYRRTRTSSKAYHAGTNNSPW